MADQEKVIKGLTCCRNGFCFSCPYNDGVDGNVDCKQKWADDALELLKAQEPVEPQEKREGDYKNLYCGVCGRGIVGYVENLTGKHFKISDYCYKCGQAVKWE